jgi:hypothetical protein
MYFAEEVAVADVAIMRALAPRAHVPADRGVFLLAAALPELLFPVQFLLHGLGSFCHRLSSGQLFLHESHALILLMEACQFIFDDCFDLLF